MNNHSLGKTHDIPEQKKASPLKDSIDSSALLQGRDAISIIHHGEMYRLRETKQGKLILTK